MELATQLEQQATITDLMQQYAEIEGDCKLWHKYVADNRRQYALRHHEDPMNYDVTLSKPHNIVTFSKAVIAASQLRMRAVGFADTRSTMERSSNFEKFGTALWQVNKVRQTGRDPKMWYLHRQTVDGCAAAYVFLDPAHRPDSYLRLSWPECPITIEVVDTLTLYPRPSNNPLRQFEYLFCVTDVSLAELMYRYPDVDWTVHQGGAETESDLRRTRVKLYHYTGYDADNYVVQTIFTEHVLLSDERLWHASQYPGLPWVVRSCYEGDATAAEGDDQPQSMGLIERFQSILHPVNDAVKTVEMILSGDMRAHDMYANMPPVVYTQDGRDVEIDPEWGNVVKLRQGEELGWPRWPGNPPDSTRLTNFHMGDIQEASFSAAAMGYAGSSASGYHVALTTESSRMRLQLPANNWASAVAETANLSKHLLNHYYPYTAIQMYGQDAMGEGETFAFQPRSANGLIMTAEIELQLPGDDIRRTAMAAQWKGIGVDDHTIFETALSFDQPDEIWRRKQWEMAQTHPVMQLLNMIEALKARGDARYPILEALLEKAVAGSLGADAGRTAYRGPDQQAALRPMGTDSIPLQDQGYTTTPGAAPQTQEMT